MDHLFPGRNHSEEYRKALFWESLLFHIFINDLFFLVEEIESCNYAGDTTIYVCDNELQHSVSSLVIDPQKLSNWHLDNNKKLNPDQCHPSIYGGEKH